MAVHEITSLEHFKEIIQSTEKVVVEFWAAWCTPCEPMKVEIEKLATDLGDSIKVYAVDVATHKDVALAKDIQGVPTVIVFQKGKEKERISGYKKAEIVKKLLKL